MSELDNVSSLNNKQGEFKPGPAPTRHHEHGGVRYPVLLDEYDEYKADIPPAPTRPESRAPRPRPRIPR